MARAFGPNEPQAGERVGGCEYSLHLALVERKGGAQRYLGQFEDLRGVVLDPAGVQTEAQERTQVVQSLDRGQGGVRPAVAKRPQRRDVELLEMVQPVVLAEGQELALQQLASLLEGGLREMPRLGILEVEAGGLLDCGRDDLDDADFAGRFPAVDRGGRGRPFAGAERALDPLATQGSLDPDRAVAAGPSTPLPAVGTGLGVPAEEPQTAGGRARYVLDPSMIATCRAPIVA